MKMKMLVVGSVLWALLGAPAAFAVPTLWGVDEDDGQLFSIGDYTNPVATFTNYGKLQWNDNGTLRDVGAFGEAFTLDGTMAYFARNHTDLGSFAVPVFMRFDVATAVPGGPNTVTVVGTMAGITFNSIRDNISGFAIQPGTGTLFALFRDDTDAVPDRLLTINKATGAVLTNQLISGLGHRIGSGEDLVFDTAGHLFVTDDVDDHLYQVDPATAAIIAVVNDDEKRGLGISSAKIEGLAWDFQNNRLIATDDDNDLFVQLSLTNGNGVSYGAVPGITDVEGIAFVPALGTTTTSSSTSTTTSSSVPVTNPGGTPTTTTSTSSIVTTTSNTTTSLPGPCVPTGPESGHCNDMIDNDCDQKIDCTDPDCGLARCVGGTQNLQDCSTDALIQACTAGGGVCQCPVLQKDPTTITFGPQGAKLDRLKSHGRVTVIGSVDVLGSGIGFLVSNSRGRIYDVFLNGTMLTANPAGTAFKYFNSGARTDGGVYKALVRVRSGTSYTYTVEAYGDMAGATDADMAIQFYLGNLPTSAVHTEQWTRTKVGWKATGQ